MAVAPCCGSDHEKTGLNSREEEEKTAEQRLEALRRSTGTRTLRTELLASLRTEQEAIRTWPY